MPPKKSQLTTKKRSRQGEADQAASNKLKRQREAAAAAQGPAPAQPPPPPPPHRSPTPPPRPLSPPPAVYAQPIPARVLQNTPFRRPIRRTKMAPPNTQKRMKLVSIQRPFVFGTTAKAFDPVHNPKPAGVPADHTHSWTAFVKGIDDTDITYWCKKVQFKLHESIPNPLRTIEAGGTGQAFECHETGWGEFEMGIKIHFVAESNEKPQQFYHNLHLHAYGTEAEKAAQIANREVLAWCYSEVVWNEPYEKFYDMLIAAGREFIAAGQMGALGSTVGKKKGGKGKGAEKPVNPLERTALIPEHSSPGQPFSKEIEQLELEKLNEGKLKIEEMIKIITAANKVREAENAKLRAALAAKEAKDAAAKAAKESTGAQ